MVSRPEHLTAENAARFQDQSVVDRYQFRLPYPPETFSILLELIVDYPQTVLDIGTGLGDLARHLVQFVDHVDAIDLSSPMTRKGRTLQNGHHPNLRWTTGALEQVKLRPPYSLITAGDSLQWMDWDVVLPRLSEACSPNGILALVSRQEILPSAWKDGLRTLIGQYATDHVALAFDLVGELEQRHLFQKVGERETAPVTYTAELEDYIASFHSGSSLSLDRMPAADAAAFDQGIRDLVAPWTENNQLQLQRTARIIWGKPQSPNHQN
ncbi:class I SAM-dependent methyltransferase [Dictyobacter arantiisoli]|uniref:Methyltransferase domain-containing protein n=1 Tax=Dictyobacter arantiisoli TaxID=2014874 RepID=A0A5A5TAI8_9CHLR|nr:class I SAM-dependent methyltransferase [Dictyobacter arantiisoli]GCF08367.1 hypothetical protein KDI_19310 [Dictyobacter arantiisoli]